ncbi:MAG: hypothetical protein IJD91_04710 [Clostridia bacterium]|nr:hypothetical protein [Clostridia bacterium]
MRFFASLRMTPLYHDRKKGWEKVVQSVQTEPKGYPKLYDGTARGEVCAEQNA